MGPYDGRFPIQRRPCGPHQPRSRRRRPRGRPLGPRDRGHAGLAVLDQRQHARGAQRDRCARARLAQRPGDRPAGCRRRAAHLLERRRDPVVAGLQHERPDHRACHAERGEHRPDDQLPLRAAAVDRHRLRGDGESVPHHRGDELREQLVVGQQQALRLPQVRRPRVPARQLHARRRAALGGADRAGNRRQLPARDLQGRRLELPPLAAADLQLDAEHRDLEHRAADRAERHPPEPDPRRGLCAPRVHLRLAAGQPVQRQRPGDRYSRRCGVRQHREHPLPAHLRA